MRPSRAHRAPRRVALAALATMLVAGCGTGTTEPSEAPAASSGGGSAVSETVTATASTPAEAAAAATPTTPVPVASAPVPAVGGVPPSWLGTRVLAEAGVGQPTPAELDPRAFTLTPELPPPVDGRFTAGVSQVPADVLARSSWHAGCPVSAAQLRYVTVSFWGFDDRPHTGELLVNARVADDLVRAFQALYEARVPIEQMRITTAAEVDAPPTGDGNNTGAFVCRASVGSGTWSQHAYGLAVDVNPFQNPYSKGATVIPELATSYLRRDDERPGMITADGPVVQAFADIGWGWGGSWRSSKDYMHFSANGR